MPGTPLPRAPLPSRRTALGIAGIAALTGAVAAARPAFADDIDPTVLTVDVRTPTAVVNAWLAGGGTRSIRGPIVLTAPLVVPSGTHLDARGASITGPATDNILQNRAAIPTARTTAAVVAGSTAIRTKRAVFDAGSVGRAVQVLGTGPRAGRPTAPGSTYGRIVSVQSPSRATMSVPATSTASAATTYLFPPDDSDITITGGTWTNRNANDLSQTTQSHGFLIRRAPGVTLQDMTVHSTGNRQLGGQYAASFGDVRQVAVLDVAFVDTASDGVHFQGPASSITVRRVSGVRTGDDLVAFTTVDGQSHDGSLLGDCEGDITDVVVEDIDSDASLCMLKITSGIGAAGVQRRIKRFSATGFTGTTLSRSPVQIVNYAGPTWFEGTLADMSAIGSGGPTVNVTAGALGALVVQDISRAPGTPACPDGLVRIAATTASSVTVERITNRSTAGYSIGVALALGAANAVSISGIACPVLAPKFDSVRVVRANSTIGSLSITDDTSAARDGNVFGIDAAAGGYRIGKATFARISRATGSLWAADSDSTTSSVISVAGFQGGRAIALLRAPARLDVQGMKQPAGSGGGVRLNSTAASPVRVVASDSARPGPLVSRTAAQRLSAASPFIGLDAALLTPADGDVVLNTGTKYPTGQIRWDAKAKRWRTTTVARPATPAPAPAPTAAPTPSRAPTATPGPTSSPHATPTTPTPTVDPTPPAPPSSGPSSPSPTEPGPVPTSQPSRQPTT